MKMSIRVIPFILLFFLVSGCGKEESEKERGVVNEWLSFNEGMALAKKERKPVVIDFYTSWCRWCKVMDERTFSKREIAKYLADNFVSIRINAESRSGQLTYKGEEYTPVQFTRKLRVRGFPSLAYLDTEGEMITVVPGYVPPETFLPFLKYIKQECYTKQMSFEEFLKKKEECEE